MWNEAQLDEALSTPSQALIDDMAKLDGDIMILGAGGKVGPTLSVMAKRAVEASGVDRKVIAVSRFTDPFVVALMEKEHVECISCDLTKPEQIAKLPKVKNIIYMAGRKFGTNGAECETWEMNVAVPAYVTQHFGDARYVVFTTEVVGFPGMRHIGPDKDFTPVIEKALELGGFDRDVTFPGINGGESVMTGFGRNAVLSAAGTVIEAVKSGAIKHFFLVGGCDGARPGRSYYTEFVRQTPRDTLVLTLACGKYRFNDLDLGTIGGLPRLLDIGQCNDAYSAIQIALVLADAFGCGVNDLPLSMILSWYEQKAVCILLTLLHLGIRNIRLGPSLPAFLSPNVLSFLVEKYGIAPITTPEADLKEILS